MADGRSQAVSFVEQAGIPAGAYVRCELPARALGAQFRHPTGVPTGAVSVWQIPATLAWRYEMKRAKGRVFVDIDDDYSEWDKKYRRGRWVEEWPLESDVPSVAVHRQQVREATGVICATEPLAERYQDLNPNVSVCENCVDPDDWPELSEPDGIFRIVYAGTTLEHDLQAVAPILTWAAAQPGVEAWLLGATYDPGWPGVKTILWQNDLAAYRRILMMIRPNVGIRPLLDDTFSRRKSDLKILEYAMAGALSIVSDREPYRGWRDGPVKFVADDGDWIGLIRWSIQHQEEVTALAAECRWQVLANRSLERVRTQWENALGLA